MRGTSGQDSQSQVNDMNRRYDNILATIGRTPVVKLNRLAPAGVNLYVKLEAFNPMGSVKDRLALGVIEAAERRRDLGPGQTVVAATGGDVGIGLAMVCAQRGYPLVVVMSEDANAERRAIMRLLGAKVVHTSAASGSAGSRTKATELAQKNGWFHCRKFDDRANADIHARTTAREIVETFEDAPLDFFVTGYGTGGTLSGVARVLWAQSPDTQIVACEPEHRGIPGSGSRQTQADNNSVDRVVEVSGADALHFVRELARSEGIFAGVTAGAVLAAAIEVCRTAPPGANVLCLLPDSGERHLGTPLVADLRDDMCAQEIALSKSTPSCRFDMPSVVVPFAPAPRHQRGRSNNRSERRPRNDSNGALAQALERRSIGRRG